MLLKTGSFDEGQLAWHGIRRKYRVTPVCQAVAADFEANPFTHPMNAGAWQVEVLATKTQLH
jgi:hypothetical protein